MQNSFKNYASTWLSLLVIALSLFGGAALLSQSNTTAPSVFADGSGSPDDCTENQNPSNVDGSITGTDDLVTKTAPSGKIVTGVCIKSGNNMFLPNKHSGVLGNGTHENNCYTVSGIGTNQVTVERTGTASNTCQEISHIDVIYGNEPSVTPTPTPTTELTPTPTNTPTPTEIPTPTPTDALSPTPTPRYVCTGNICIICPGQGTCEVEIGTPSGTLTPTISPSASPSPTATPSASVTPTPTSGGGTGGNNDNGSTDNSSTGTVAGASTGPAVGGQVLGASTLAATGTFASSASNLGIIAGVLLIASSVSSRLRRIK